MVEKQRCPLQRDAVYRWFSQLSSSQRVDFLCGLLDLCIPLELRFLGSCLEDLARKDYHSLRDSEIKANNPADLGSLTNLTDEVVRSRLLVSLALLSSDNREAAGVLCRTLTHIDSIINNYGLQLNDGRTGDEFLLLFTMASNHPAFSFHQKQVLSKELIQIQSIIETANPPSSSALSSAPSCPNAFTATTTTVSSSSKTAAICHKASRAEVPIRISNSLENALPTSAHSIEETSSKRPSGKHSKVSVEKVELKGMLLKKNERNFDCSFEVLWSDSSLALVTKSYAEVSEFISKLSQMFPEENLEKFIPYRSGLDSFSPEINHMDLELDLRYLSSLPSHMLKNEYVKKFFSTYSPVQQHQSPNLGNTSLHKMNATVAASIRPICGVASIQSSQISTPHHSGALVPCPHSGSSSSSLPCRPQMDTPPAILMTSSLQSPQTQEQQEILEWLRKLRLHKYYTVFSQLSMKKFLSLTEEDLNKFESLTMGAKKKLKTQLELEKEKSERRCLNPTINSSVNSSGIARIPPTSHVGPLQSCCNHAADLRVDVEPSAHHIPREGSSSSEYSSSPSSPMGIQVREESSDSAEENERQMHLECCEKDKPVMLLNHFPTSSVRPTAQVLPVQNDAGSNPSSHHPLPLQTMTAVSSHIAPIHIMNSMHKSDRGSTDIKLLSSSVHSLLPLEERNKVSPGPRSSIKVEKSFGNMLDVMPTPSLQSLQALSAVPENSSVPPTVNFGVRTKVGHPTMDRVIKTAPQPTLIVESSTAATLTSSTVFHVARPPVKLLVPSSIPSDSSVVGQTPCSSSMQISVSPAIISPRTALYTPSTKAAFSAVSSMPVAPVPGSFCAISNTATSSSHQGTSFTNMTNLSSCPAPSSSPTLPSVAENSYYSSSGSGPTVNLPLPNQTPHHHHHHHHHQQQQQTGCMVCSSCGCSGNCGSGGMAVTYANYFQHPFSPPSMFTFPFLPFSPLCNNGYINTQQYNSGTSFPVVHSPYNSSLNPDSMLSGGSNFAVSPMQNFMTGTAGVYQPQGMIGNPNSTGHRKSGNLSCYNCGASGHRAQDCKQPPMDFNQQGTFRLKYAPPTESLNNTD
uniref:Zinc finger CCHC domain-containing protein 14 isoform X1 n=1 Tax=Geotrypetes seraphini TaxID=260995 RepID=A0A6P8QNK3_GEOSA|nr:zinc finger CCHC domain-containing protein 14 isoform X1 [Geotrypetes seraphini]